MDAMSKLDRQLRDLASRCDRAKPSCSNCVARHIYCIYPDGRKERRPRVPLMQKKQRRKSESHLDALFERLQNLEEKCLHLVSNLSAEARSQERQSSPASFDVESLAHVVPTSGQHTTSSPVTTSTAQTAPEIDPMAGEASSSCIAKRPQHSLDTSTLLKRAFDQVLGLKQQSINEWIACSDVCIRQKISKACVQNFCKHYQLDIFPNFINTKLMHLIPDIIAMPEVSLDPATVVLYYGILYQESLVASTDLTRQDKYLTQSIYACCLREMPTWLQKGTNRLAFDVNQMWADGNLGGLKNSDRLSSEANQDRGSLWGLALADLIFRLIHDKPALLMADLAEWQVNVPWLDVEPKHLQPHVPTLVSLAKSQLVLILLRFFDTVDREGENKAAMADHVRFLCAEVEQLFLEWAVEPEDVVTKDIALLESLTQNIAAIADIDKTLLPVVFALWELLGVTHPDAIDLAILLLSNDSHPGGYASGHYQLRITQIIVLLDHNNINPHSQQSIILVPSDTPGIVINRMLNVYGYDDAPHGHGHLTFKNLGPKIALKQIAEAKVLVSQTVLTVIDRAIQAFGGAGVTQDTSLAYIWASIRTLRLADGPGEVYLQYLTRNEAK
ncbi:hypothetical protein FDECE_8512 [Fusarium decemcellulare]|nr:hypothetical protein FDECE_8512 [Fusarium decemcellulare]